MGHIDRSMGHRPGNRRGYPNNLCYLPARRHHAARWQRMPARVIPLHSSRDLGTPREVLTALAFVALWVVAVGIALVAGARAMHQWPLDVVPGWPWW